MKLFQIDYFLEVAEQLNFTKAANILYVSQPALSKQIALLEEELGVKLFVRTSRKVALTTAGQQFEKDLKEIRLLVDNAKEHAIQARTSKKQTLRIACFDGQIFDDFLPQFYEHIKKLDSDMNIQLTRGNFFENKAALEQGAADILITLQMDCEELKDCGMHKMTPRESALIFSKTFFRQPPEQYNPKDFYGKKFLIIKRELSPGIYRKNIETIEKLGIINPIILEHDNMSTLIANLEMGQGFTILASDVAKCNDNLIHYPLPDEMKTWVVAVWKHTNTLAELVMDDFKY